MKKNVSPSIAVILPIYRDTAMTLACIESALPAILTLPNAKLIAINDASPDEDMQQALENIAKKYPQIIHLLANKQNLGFVATVNRGMRYFAEHDVVLLNSDVLLPDADWLTRLYQDAYDSDDIASVTPLSNNTTICTFPDFLQDNPIPFGLSVTEIDAAFKTPRYPCVEAPTGVGFCMYIRRKALSEVGYFDEETFGRGYGEENDFCQRAIQAGYRNLISPNIYAYHLGGVSFADEKDALIERACQVIDKRYPNYHSDVQNFIAKDPLRTARIYRLVQLIANTDLPKILHISHGTGGGVEQQLEELADVLGNHAISLTLVPEGDNGLVKLSLSVRQTVDSLYFDFAEDYDNLLTILNFLGIGLLHFHHTVRFGEQIFSLPNDLNIPHLFTIHDFYLLGGNPTLSDETGVYPGYFDETLQNPMYPYPKGVSRESFRQQHRRIIETAEIVLFPSAATKKIFSNTYRLNKTQIVVHPEIHRNINAPIIPIAKKAHYTIGIFGAVSREKGADLVEAMAVYATKQHLPLDFVIIGYAYRPLKQVKTTGPFVRQELTNLAKQQGIDIAFFSARWPETYSYTLSYAMDLGLPIMAPNLGAFPERLTNRPLTLLFNHLDNAETLTKALYEFICNSATTDTTPVMPIPRQDDHFYTTDYLTYVKSPKVLSKVKLLPAQFINVDKKPAVRINSNEKLVVNLWKIYSHPSMRWVNKIIPFRVRRGLKRLLSRQAIHDLVNKYDNTK